MSMKRDSNAQERSHIFLNIGHFDMDKEPMILHVDPFRNRVAPAQIPESSLSLQITAIDCDAPLEYWVSFPVIEDLANDPFYFSAQDPGAAKLRSGSSALSLDKITMLKNCHPLVRPSSRSAMPDTGSELLWRV